MLNFTLLRILTKARLYLTVTTWHILTVPIPISTGMWTVFHTVFITAGTVFPYKKTMPCFKEFVAGLSERRIEFDVGSVHVGFFCGN